MCDGNAASRHQFRKRSMSAKGRTKTFGAKKGEGAATLNAAPSWITPGKMGVQGGTKLAIAT